MRNADTIGSGQIASSGGLVMLDVIVLIAMAVTATAFAAGLTVHSGVAMAIKAARPSVALTRMRSGFDATKSIAAARMPRVSAPGDHR